ncbi:putative ribonuclease H-like domain-containing protein [Tanacetum coccineum]
MTDFVLGRAVTDAALRKRGKYMAKCAAIGYGFLSFLFLLDVIENGNSFKLAAQTTTNADGSSTTLIPGHVTADEKTIKKNDVKARSMLLMALPNEHLLIFNQYKDDKNLLQKIVSQLAILGENISQEDLNLKFLRSLPSEWNTHVVVWRNKPDLDTMSFDDLYNNFKIVEQEVKGTASSSSSLSSQNLAFMSSTSSTNEVNTAYGVSTSNTQVSIASTQVSTANLSDDTIYAFLASQPNGSQLVYEDLEQIHEDDIEEMDLKWQLALLSMRTRRGPRNQDSRNRNQDSSRRTVNVEETSSKAMVAIDGAGFDWSYMADSKVWTKSGMMSLKIFYECRESPDALMVEKLVLDDKLEKKKNFPTVAKIEFVRPKQQEKPANCNYHQRERVVSGNNYTRVNYNYSAQKAHQSAQRNMAPRAVLMKTSPRPLNTARPVNTAHPKTTVYSARPMPKAVNTARPNIEIANAVRENQVNAVKASACWVWRPTKLNSASITFKRHNYVNARGRSKSVMAWTLRKLMKDILPLVEEPKEEELLMCDKKNSVLFTDTGCFVLSPDFKLADESQATLDESMLWHKRLGHVNFKTINKHFKDNLMKGLPIKHFENDQTCIACLKGKQYKASSSKDETSGILKSFITQIENLVDKKVKIIRCDNGTEFKNRVMSEFCEKKGIKREFSVARTSQQNDVAERRNRTLIEAARTMLADSKLPTTFWVEAVNTACYVQNRVLVVKPHNKTPYELFIGRTPSLSFMKPFGYHVTILNTLDHLGKFDGKFDDGFFVGYSLNSKAFRVYIIRTRKVKENLHVRFLEDKPIIAGDGPKWLFDIDVLTKSMNYVPVIVGTNSNDSVGTKESIGKENLVNHTSVKESSPFSRP